MEKHRPGKGEPQEGQSSLNSHYSNQDGHWHRSTFWTGVRRTAYRFGLEPTKAVQHILAPVDIRMQSDRTRTMRRITKP